jgi:phage terminase large subunit-like protein
MAAWSFAQPDWERRLELGLPLAPDLPLDEDEAERAVRIFDRLRLPDVAGQPPFGDSGEWLRENIVRPVFGSLDENGVRRVPEVFALVPKKMSKTTGGAAIGLTGFILNERPLAEILVIGPTQEIADLAFGQAAGMIAADPAGYLQSRFKVRDHLKAIEDELNGSVLKIKTFDPKVMTGAKPLIVVVDELHVMSSMHYASRVIGQIRGGLAARPEGFLIFITTQSDTPPAGVFKAELQLARAIRDGRVKGEAARMLPILYEFPEATQTDPAKPWADPRRWPMVMPNLGRPVTLDWLKADFAAAKEKGEEEVRRWASQHLNVEIGLALHSDRWAGADYWEAAADRTITKERLLADCDVVVAAVDGGGLDDLYGLALMGRCAKTRDWLWWSRAWCQPEVLERRKEIAERLRDFRDDGDLVICERATQDVEEAAAIIAEFAEAGLLPAQAGVGLDPFGVAATIDELALNGIAGEQVVAVPQGVRLSAAVWGAERKLKDGTLWHAGSRLMAWCASNAKVEQRGNAVLVTKQAAGKAKIDPLIAGFNAVQLMSRNPEGGGGPSVYETRGIIEVAL